MLVLTRKSDESVMVGNAIEVKVLAIKETRSVWVFRLRNR